MVHVSRSLLALVLVTPLFAGAAVATPGRNAESILVSSRPAPAENAPPPEEIIYAPEDSAEPAPVTVFLHGMCDTPENECPVFARAVTRHGWLVCPRAPVACANGGSMWSTNDRAERIEASLTRLRARYSGRVLDGDRTLIGFSQGAFVGADLVQRKGSPWAHILLIAAKAPFDAQRIADSGVERLLFAAGEYDGSSKHMADSARRLARSGIDVEFRSLGKVGHRFAGDMNGWLDDALGWLWSERR